MVLFHTYDKKTELTFDFDNSPKKFVDVETGEELNLYADNIKEDYKSLSETFFNELKKNACNIKIDYVPVDINEGFDTVLTAYLLVRKNFTINFFFILKKYLYLHSLRATVW